jgi:hypothetical protein
MLKVVTSADRVLDLEGRNLIQGRPARHLHGRCQTPVEVFMLGLADPTHVKLDLDHERYVGGTFLVPCRKCQQCMLSRRNLWSERARIEYRTALRTWFVTLTFGPDARSSILWSARKEVSRSGDDFDALDADERFAALERKTSRYLTLWLKRVRRTSGATLRYFAVSEPHEDGMPHYHALVHEVGGRVTKRELQSSWPQGFSLCKLSENDLVVRYVAKYIAKHRAARIRASLRYGDNAAAIDRATSIILRDAGLNKPAVGLTDSGMNIPMTVPHITELVE